MKIYFSPHFKRSFNNFSPAIQRKFQKQITYLLQNIRHPSLHAKKYDEERDIWQARVDRGIRFYFLIKGDTYSLLEIRKHPK